MNDIQSRYTPEELSKLAEECGKMFALFVNGFIKGYAAQAAALKGPQRNRHTGDGKTSADCCNCWCDQCANVDYCNEHREGIQLRDGMPLPCCGCGKGEMFAPIGNPPPCGKFKAG